MQLYKHRNLKGSGTLSVLIKYQNISDCNESEFPKQLFWLSTDFPYLHEMFFSNMSNMNIRIFKQAVLRLRLGNITAQNKSKKPVHETSFKYPFVLLVNITSGKIYGKYKTTKLN